MQFTHSVMAQNEAVVAGTVVSYDLPVNPLSHVLLTLKFAQNQADTQLTFANIPAMLSKVEVLYKGSAIFSMSGLDALAVGLFLCNFESWCVNADGNDNDLRSLTLLIPLGRRLYDPRECFPRSTRGELILQLTYASSFTQIDGVSAQIETVELPEAAPEQFLRVTTLSVTPTAAGEMDVELPIGNIISDLVLFGTTIPAADVATTTLLYLQILVDNDRRFYSHINFETVHNMAGRLRAGPGYHGSHAHRYITAAVATYYDTLPVDPADHVLKNHLHLPFDVLGDGSYALDTKGSSDVIVRIYAGDTSALRVLPCEIVASGKGY